MSKTGTKSKQSIDSAALTVSGPQPVWMTLNEARERAFTGEVVFEVEPEVLAYLDNGVVYYAERSADPSLGRRLVDAGVLDTGQLERGTVRVGDVEHLGRLFDRDPSVDRDAVLVVAEAETEVLISQLANEAITTVRVTAYRHHPSGVHRWFVGPVEPAANPRPIGEVAQLDTTVVDDLPGLPVASASDAGSELTIEWEESLDGFEDLEPLPAIDEFDASMLEAMLDGGGELEVEIISDAPEEDIADWDESVQALLDFSTEPDSAEAVQIDPDVAVQRLDLDPDSATETEPETELWLELHDDLVQVNDDLETDTSEDLVVEDVAVEDLVVDEPAPDSALFDSAEIIFDDVVLDEDLVVEDVVVVEHVVVEDDVVVGDETVETPADEAVVAAIDVVGSDTVVEDEESVWEADTSDDLIDREFQVVWPDDVDGEDTPAIVGDSVEQDDSADSAPLEHETYETPVIQTTADGLYFEMPPLDLNDKSTSGEDVPDDVADAVRRAIAAIESAAVGSPSIAPISDPGPGDANAPAPAAFDAFAPPSMDTSAEVLYSQWETDAAEAATVSDSRVAPVEAEGEGALEPADDAGDERSSALRRLIGSLRRKDR